MVVPRNVCQSKRLENNRLEEGWSETESIERGLSERETYRHLVDDQNFQDIVIQGR